MRAMTLEGLLVAPIDGGRAGAVSWENGVITSVEPRTAEEAGGRYVFPGFVDLQIYDWACATTQGVTGYLATLGPAAPGGAEAFLASLPDDPACLGAHLEGPYVNPEAAGARPAAHIRPVDPDAPDGVPPSGRG